MLMEILTKVAEVSPVPKWVKWLAFLVGGILWAWPFMERLTMIEISNIILLECAAALILGAFVGPAILLQKSKSMGNVIDKTDFIGILVGIVLGAFTGYLALNLYGGAWTVALGDLSYMAVTLVASVVGAMVFTLIALVLAGDDWAVKCLKKCDLNNDGQINLDDARALAEKLTALVNQAKPPQ